MKRRTTFAVALWAMGTCFLVREASHSQERSEARNPAMQGRPLTPAGALVIDAATGQRPWEP
jgi:hypothetical protein